MANTINTKARSQINDIKSLHDQISNFVNFLDDFVLPHIGTSYNRVPDIPAVAQRAIDAKAFFDSLNYAPAVSKRLLEKDLAYENWNAEHTSDLNSIVLKAGILRDYVTNNISEFAGTYDSNFQPVYLSASPAVQTELASQINSIMSHVA